MSEEFNPTGCKSKGDNHDDATCSCSCHNDMLEESDQSAAHALAISVIEALGPGFVVLGSPNFHDKVEGERTIPLSLGIAIDLNKYSPIDVAMTLRECADALEEDSRHRVLTVDDFISDVFNTETKND